MAFRRALARKRRPSCFLMDQPSSFCTNDKKYLNLRPYLGRNFTTRDQIFYSGEAYSSSSRSDYQTSGVVHKDFTDSYGDRLSVSPEVINSMIGAALDKKDKETIKLIIKEANRVGRLSNQILETSIQQCLTAHSLECASELLSIAAAQNFIIGEALCQSLIHQLVSHLMWRPACNTALYMVSRDYLFRDREIFFIVGGLMRDARGVALALELIALLTDKRRSDVSNLFSFTKVNNFSRSMGGSHSWKGELPVSAVQRAVDSSLRALKDGWFSFSMSKMVVALACGARHDDIAIDYVRKAIDAVIRGQIKKSDRLPVGANRTMVSAAVEEEPMDLLSVLRGFSQGAGVASQDESNYTSGGVHEYSPLSAVVLQLLVANMQLAGMREGPLQCMDLLKTYWVLSHRIRMRSTYVHTNSTSSSGSGSNNSTNNFIPLDIGLGIHSSDSSGGLCSSRHGHGHGHSINNGGIGAATDDAPPLPPQFAVETEKVAARGDHQLRTMYADLKKFYLDPTQTASDCSPAPGYVRMSFRTLCDEMGLRHKMLESSVAPDTVRVWKQEGRIALKPPTLGEILRNDARRGKDRRIDVEPPYWEEVQTQVQSLPKNTLHTVALGVTQSMRASYPSACWGLQWLDLLEENKIPLSRGMLRNVLNMCDQRSDVYGLLEVMYAAQRAEDANGMTAARVVAENSASRSSSGSGLGQSQDGGPSTSSGFSSFSSHTDGGNSDNSTFSASAAGQNNAHEGVEGVEVEIEIEVEADRLLRQRDWNRACQTAWHCRINMPPDSFKEAFTEVMRLMREFGVDLEPSTTRTLLRFLVHTQPASELTWKIIHRLYRDKGAQVTHIECIAATVLLLQRLPRDDRAIVTLARPLYRSENYLFVYPGALTEIVDTVIRNVDFLGMPFIESFEPAWQHLHSQGGRDALYTLMLQTVSMRGRRTEMVRDASEETRRAVSLVCAYTAYLVAAHDGSYRRAFDLLYAVESLCKEAEEYQVSLAEAEAEREGEDEEEEGENEEVEGSGRAGGYRKPDGR